MRIIRPFEWDLAESTKLMEELSSVANEISPPTDSELTKYVETFWLSYRATVEELFPSIASSLPLHQSEAYETIVLRIGDLGVILAHRPSAIPSARVTPLAEVGLAVESLNILTLPGKLGCTHIDWFGIPRSYAEEAARLHAVQTALNEALGHFWRLFKPEAFEELCLALLTEEGFDVAIQEPGTARFDATGVIEMREPGGFRRKEVWVFEFKHHRVSRATTDSVARLHELLDPTEQGPDVACLLTSGDLTSISTRIANSHPRVRIWDRQVLDSLLHKHSRLLSSHFANYAAALAKTQTTSGLNEDNLTGGLLREALKSCPAGQEDFRRFENLGAKILTFLLGGEVGPPKPQAATADLRQRRDILFRNNRRSRFMQRLADRWKADFLIVDFKNYADPVGPEVVTDVQKYANAAVGHFILVVSRKGANQASGVAQHRYLRDQDTCILTLSDEHILEMINRKMSGQEPLDVVEDLYDEFLRQY